MYSGRMQMVLGSAKCPRGDFQLFSRSPSASYEAYCFSKQNFEPLTDFDRLVIDKLRALQEVEPPQVQERVAPLPPIQPRPSLSLEMVVSGQCSFILGFMLVMSSCRDAAFKRAIFNAEFGFRLRQREWAMMMSMVMVMVL